MLKRYDYVEEMNGQLSKTAWYRKISVDPTRMFKDEIDMFLCDAV